MKESTPGPITTEILKTAFGRWIKRLGLAWWDIEIHYYDDPGEIVRLFRQIDNGDVVPAFVDANWMYADAKISVNLPAFEDMEPDKIERIVVHELMHILVSEMREGELHHEERVVTQLTKALFWALDMANDAPKAVPNPSWGRGYAEGYADAIEAVCGEPVNANPPDEAQAAFYRELSRRKSEPDEPPHGFFPGTGELAYVPDAKETSE